MIILLITRRTDYSKATVSPAHPLATEPGTPVRFILQVPPLYPRIVRAHGNAVATVPCLSTPRVVMLVPILIT